ncbi:hypothetical protein F11_12025 [Rhodospirillum rubrum F11]|nr:hypothetical protein F11_12025 [Rhodospirillum rubrum F11]
MTIAILEGGGEGGALVGRISAVRGLCIENKT